MDVLIPVLLFAFLVVMIYLDKKKILQYNKLPIFMIFLYISPLLIGVAAGLMITSMGLLGLSFSPGVQVTIITMWAMVPPALVMVIFALYILMRVCKNPIDKKAVKGSYDAALLKRLTFYRRAALIPAVLILTAVFITFVMNIASIASMSLAVMANPLFWLFNILMFGIPLSAMIIYSIMISVATAIMAVTVGSMGLWLYLVYLAFSFVQLVHLYRFKEIDRKQLLLWGLGLLVFPINLFMSPIITKAAKTAIAHCEEKYKQQREQDINRETAKLVSAEAIWNDTKPTDTETTNS